MESWMPILFSSVLLIIALISDRFGYDTDIWDAEEAG
jgi:hypothetical protein